MAGATPLAAIWELPLRTLAGAPTTLAAHRGQAILLVNVASECGLTPQYAGLQALHARLAPRGFTVIGAPCNQFGAQEPGTAAQIQAFCSTRYGVTFPLLEKLEVNGPGRHPLYAALSQVADAGGYTGDVRWNFEKFVLSADGAHVARFDPELEPDDPALIAAIERALPR